MSCAYRSGSPDTLQTRERPGSDWLAAMRAIVSAFREALTMRRAAHQCYFLGDE
jgi:hypothetical protein